ncbi:MAG: FadR family transcriptional regulator [bacterium]|nr:FadR family transcriptional regulator [bacterium]
MTKKIKETVKLLNPVSKNRLHEEIVTQIQKKIINGELKIGEKLPPERDLAENLNVNRATVREALKKLEILGLIEIHHGDGIYIKDYLESGNLELLKALIYMDNELNVDILKNLLDIRKILVPRMAYQAALNITEKQLKELEETINRKDIPMLEQDLAVHHIIGRASNNILYIFILNFFNQMFEEQGGSLYFDNEENIARSEKFHRDIYTALKEKDCENAKKITTGVLEYTELRIYKTLSIT